MAGVGGTCSNQSSCSIHLPECQADVLSSVLKFSGHASTKAPCVGPGEGAGKFHLGNRCPFFFTVAAANKGMDIDDPFDQFPAACSG